MPWHVQFTRTGTIAGIARFPTRERALEEAGMLLEAGCDVLGIGADRARDSIAYSERFQSGDRRPSAGRGAYPIVRLPAA